jgi:LysM repeat protein
MRYRITDLAFRRSVAAAALIAGAVSLAGCSSLGSRSFVDPSVTGSTGQTVGTAAVQTMPAPLAIKSTGNGPYLPPADVGRPISVAPVTTASVTQAPATTAGMTSVKSQPLPPLLSPGSQTSMPAQSTVQVASAPAPVVAAPQPAPQTLTPPVKAPVSGPVHIISSGESLYVIARRYGVKPQVIVDANDLKSMDKIYIGQKLVIPGGKIETSTIETASIPVKKTETPAPKAVEPPKTQVASTNTDASKTVQAMVNTPASDGKFRWPLSGTVITDFADSRSGINIAAQEGTAVRAAESGTIIYTGSAVQGYGNLILIKHANGYVSAYAHLKDITVAKGEAVGRGDAIGSTGMTGGVSRPQLHFELRKGATPVDPMPLLAG